MSIIKYKNFSIDIDFNEFLFIKSKDMLTFYGDLLSENIGFFIDSLPFFDKKIIISPLTKFSDLYSLNKSNVFYKYLLSKVDFNVSDIFNNIKVEEFRKIINTNETEVDFDLPEDVTKIFPLFIDIDKEKLLTKNNFLFLLHMLKTTNSRDPLIIFDIEWIDEKVINILIELKINFIFVTSNFSKWHKLIKENIEHILFQENEVLYSPTLSDVENKTENDESKIYVTV